MSHRLPRPPRSRARRRSRHVATLATVALAAGLATAVSMPALADTTTTAHRAPQPAGPAVTAAGSVPAATELFADARRRVRAGEERRRALLERRAREAAAAASRARRAWLDRWVAPLASYRLSAGFGQAGPAWASGHHTGQDFVGPAGAPVMAVARGTITFAGRDGRYGNKVVVTHPDGTQTWYCHLAGFARTSGRVQAGTVIGFEGETGNAFGPHLHLEVHPYGGAAVDPLVWLRDHHAAGV